MFSPTRFLLLIMIATFTLVNVACQKEEPTTREFQVQATDDVTLHARSAGITDPAAVLIAINGGPGLSSSYMLDLEQLAGRDLSVVTYDQRGTGRSTSPNQSATNYELSDYVADLDAVRQGTGAGQVHLLGHSWGGVVALAYAAEHPEHVSSLILAGSGPPAWRDISLGFANLQKRIQTLQQNGAIPEQLPADAEEQLLAILPAYFSDPAFSFSALAGPPKHNQMINSLTWQVVRGYDLTTEVRELNHPVLILYGKDDPFGPGMAEATRDALTNAQVEYVLLDACGHFWHECPETFYPPLREFLSGF